MKLLEAVFVLLHIKISHIKLFIVPGRVLMTLIFVMLLAFSSAQLYVSTETPMNTSGFVESMLYAVFVAYSFLFWMKAWPKADKMLKKAANYEKKSKTRKE